MTRPRIVLVGCSFAGLEFLYRYTRRRGRLSPGELTVVEPRSHHPYVPLAHEAAGGVTAPQSLLFDIEAFCASIGAGFIRDAATGVDTRARLLHNDGGSPVPYDRLVVAVGSESAIPAALAQRGIVPAKWITDGLELRERLHGVHTATGVPARLTIVGIGITGVEWAAELSASPIGGLQPVVTVVGREARLLPEFAPGVAHHAGVVLDRLGVRRILGRMVSDVTADSVVLDDGEHVPSDVVVWAGGVRPNPVVKAFGLPLTSDGRIAITRRLAVHDVDGVYAIGDAAQVVVDGSAWPTMQRAIEAIWQGALLARRMARPWGDDEGPEHQLRREFFYGLSLGPRHSLVLYRALWADSRIFVYFRRWLKWAYYERFTLLARWLARTSGRSSRVTRP